MYDINYKNVWNGILFGLLFLIVGIIFHFTIGYIAFGGIIRKNNMDSKVKASSIEENCYNADGTVMCQPVFKYLVDGYEYACNTEYPSSVRVSSKMINVYYDSFNPKNCVSDYETVPSLFLLALFILPFASTIVGVIFTSKVLIRIKKIKYLAKHGILIKGLAYEMVGTNMYVNEVNILAPAVNYTLPDGKTVHLIGDPRYDRKVLDDDRLVDLLIDPNNPDNFYIDFNIKRKY